ncbi:hypothetical protein ASF06_12660 [Agreia sp. Leaf244]|uniref:hypothetical protein n=1 Tax=unclassified Agreia TaxID=2641148 RepID=UPI0006F5EA10|nr:MULTISPECIES: hypothetical protein [unclassified Agreia]KQO07457.1 hypothetical protein ASF06_12660 [Agreia sp. Leaf244]KQP56050.1 hypothetical protein ASF51_13080 [Agreia sp. Leaf283]
MSSYSDEPELEGYVPHGDRPLRSERMRRAMRIVVIVGLVCLVLPGILTTASFSHATAERACAIIAPYQDPTTQGSSAHFELFGDGGLGWQCYTVGAYGGDRNVAPLGLFPAIPTRPEPGQVS